MGHDATRFYVNKNLKLYNDTEKTWLGGTTHTRDEMSDEYLTLYNNGCMIRGFRPFPLRSWWRIFLSVFERNNQAFNVQSHFVGILLVLYMMYNTFFDFPEFQENTNWVDRVIHGQFFLCVMYTFVVSVIFHTCNCAGLRTYDFVARLDFSGVFVAVTSSGLTAIYYASSCYPRLRFLYIYFGAAVYFAVAMVAILSRNHNLRIRSGLFLAIFPVSFLFFVLISRGCVTPELWSGCWKIFFGWLPYAVAFLFYISKIPERFLNSPQRRVLPHVGKDGMPCSRLNGCLDAGPCSHGLWHVFGIVAALYQIHVLNWGWLTYMGPNASCQQLDAFSAQSPGFVLSFYERMADWWDGRIAEPEWGAVLWY